MKVILAYILVLLVSLSAMTSAAVRGVVPVISIESNVFNKDELSKIQKTLGLTLNEPIDLKNLDKGIKELHQTGNFQNLAIQTENTAVGVRVFILGSKIRYIRRVNFVNIDSEIIGIAKKGQDFEEGRVADLGKFSALRERIKQEYEARGYYFAEIQVMITDIPGTKEVDVEIEGKNGAPTRVSKVSIIGVTPSEVRELREVIPLKKGSIFTKENMDASAQSLSQYFRANRYPTARIEETSFNFAEDKLEVEVTYTLKLGERYQFEFVGNTVFDEIELKELLTAEVMSQNDSSVRIKELLENKYHSIGFYFTKVTVTSIQNPTDKVNLIRFDIDEGNRVIIDRIVFNGGEEVGSGRLQKLFFEDAPGVVARHLYWESGINDAVTLMTKKLELQGFLKAQVLGPRAVFTEDKKGVELFFDVELGNRTYISEVLIEGNRSVSADKVNALLPFHVGDFVNLQKIEEGKKSVLNFYQNEGFSDVKLQETADLKMLVISSDQRQASIYIRLQEGKQFFVGDITLDGNRRTQAKVVMREMRVKPGDKYSPDQLRVSEENIALLGLFSRVEIVSIPNAASPEKKDLKIVVAEIKPGLGEVGLGGAYEEPRFRLRTFLGLAYRNLMGLNQTASLRTEVAIPISHQNSVIPFLEYSAVLGYRAPHLLELPFTFSIQVGLDSFEVATIGDYPEVQTRARIEERIEKKLSSKVTGIYRLHRYERTTTEILDNKSAKNTESIGSTGPGVIVDFRNDPFNPTSGSYHTMDLEMAHPALLSQADISFMMLISRNSFYLPLLDPVGLMFHLGGGYAHSFFASPLPVARLTNELSLGGQSSLRGYSPKEYQPSVDTITPANDPRDTAYINVRTELVTPLFDNVGGALFFDTGQLYPNWIPAGRKDGVGLGIRYKTPVGPVVIDVAYGFQSREKNIKFSFTIGTI